MRAVPATVMPDPLVFGEFSLDPAARRLTQRGAPVHLTGKAFELLALLAARRPEAVSKEEIRRALWPDTFVADSNLAPIVFELRAALGESARAPRYIRTVHGYGYAFEHEPPAERARAALCRLVVGGEAIDLADGQHLVGRSRHCAVRFESSKVSRVHARITVTGNVATLEDFGSRNGTFVRGERLQRPAMLADGDEILFGTHAARFEAEPHTSMTDETDP